MLKLLQIRVQAVLALLVELVQLDQRRYLGVLPSLELAHPRGHQVVDYLNRVVATSAEEVAHRLSYLGNLGAR